MYKDNLKRMAAALGLSIKDIADMIGRPRADVYANPIKGRKRREHARKVLTKYAEDMRDQARQEAEERYYEQMRWIAWFGGNDPWDEVE